MLSCLLCWQATFPSCACAVLDTLWALRLALVLIKGKPMHACSAVSHFLQTLGCKQQCALHAGRMLHRAPVMDPSCRLRRVTSCCPCAQPVCARISLTTVVFLAQLNLLMVKVLPGLSGLLIHKQ